MSGLLLHDPDSEITNTDLKVHGLEAEKILRAGHRGIRKIDVPLNEFVELLVDAMKEIAPQIGL